MFDLDRFLADHLAAGIDDGMVDGGRVHGVIGDGMHLAGFRIEVRVGGEGILQCPAERVVRERIEPVIQAHGPGAGLDQGPGVAIVADDIGVGIVLRPSARAGGGCLAKGG